MYADSTDFSGLPDPSKNNAVDPTAADEDDGDQYVARKQRQYLETLFANANVRTYALPCPGHPEQNLTCCSLTCSGCWVLAGRKKTTLPVFPLGIWGQHHCPCPGGFEPDRKLLDNHGVSTKPGGFLWRAFKQWQVETCHSPTEDTGSSGRRCCAHASKAV